MGMDDTVIRVEMVPAKYGAMRCVATMGGKDIPHREHHSPTGMNYGYAGSGPADLALSILDAALPDDDKTATIWGRKKVKLTAWLLHQEFKWAYVAKWNPKEVVEITVGEVRAWAEAKLRELGLVEDAAGAAST